MIVILFSLIGCSQHTLLYTEIKRLTNLYRVGKLINFYRNVVVIYCNVGTLKDITT